MCFQSANTILEELTWKMAMEELMEEFADVFSVSKYDLGRIDLVYD